MPLKDKTWAPAFVEAAPPATRTDELSDFELIVQVRAGRINAFEPLMRRYNRRLYRVAKGFLKNESDAEDVVQEAYIKAFSKLSDFVGPTGFGAWLSRITANEALGFIRHSKVRVSLEEPLVSWQNGENIEREFPDLQQLSPQRMAASAELRKAIEAEIEKLPSSFRAVFMMRAIEGLSVSETAVSLHIPVDTVKTRYHRARRILTTRLSCEYEAVLSDLFEFDGGRCDRIVRVVLERLYAS